MVEIKDYERVDDLQLNGLSVIQNPKAFCFGIDAVLLANFAKVKKGETVLDLGTGTAVIPILLTAKTQGKRFLGLEIQEESVEMARRSVLLNGLENKVSIIHGDIKEMPTLFGLSSIDVITTNPPYMKAGNGLLCEGNSAKTIARHEVLCSLKDIISGSAKVLCPNGRLYMVHRPSRLVEIINELSANGLETKTLRFVHPYADKEANMVLIEAVKGGNSMVKVLEPLVVYERQGKS